MPHAQEIRRLMSLPGRDRIKNRADHVPSSVRVINKTGTTGMLCGDMGILIAKDAQGQAHAYTMVGIIQSTTPVRNYSTWKNSSGDAIGQVSSLVYDYLKKRHGLIS